MEHAASPLALSARTNFKPFMLLSMLSGILETGVFTVGVLHFGIAYGLAFALAYQAGCLARNPLRLSLRGATVLIGGALLLTWGFASLWAGLVGTLLLSAGVQSARECLLPPGVPLAVGKKRLIRVAGFVSGILGGYAFGPAILPGVAAVACAVAVFYLFRAERSPLTAMNGNLAPDRYGVVMLLHQTHYFVYAYVLLAVFLVGLEPGVEEATLTHTAGGALFFALGWLSYISGQRILKNFFGWPPLRAAVAGHLLVAACLLIMALCVDNHTVLIVAWITGGFGGGSVYAIKELASLNGCKADMELWEHWGHVLGVALALLLFIIAPRTSWTPFAAAMTAALITIALLVRENMRRLVGAVHADRTATAAPATRRPA